MPASALYKSQLNAPILEHFASFYTFECSNKYCADLYSEQGCDLSAQTSASLRSLYELEASCSRCYSIAIAKKAVTFKENVSPWFAEISTSFNEITR